MTFEEYVKQSGFDPAALTDAQRRPLLAAWKIEAAPKSDDQIADLDRVTREARDENERVRGITNLIAEEISRNPSRLDAIEHMGRLAIEGKWDLKETELKLLRAARPIPPDTTYRPDPAHNGRMLEAALAIHAGLPDVQKVYNEQTLNAAHDAFGDDLSMGQLLVVAARQNGCRVNALNKGNLEMVLRAAFREQQADIRGSITGPSTYTIPNIISNVANKIMRAQFETADQTWRKISSVRSVNDFKQNTTVALTGDLTYKLLAPGGEIRHGSIGETVYTNQASTYAIMLGIRREDLINDDTGALNSAARRAGRGAALAINTKFWGVFLNNSSFFTSGNSNVVTGGGSALAEAGLEAVDQKFRVQTDPDGMPTAIMPRILLVPPTLYQKALALMNTSFYIATNTNTATTLTPAFNTFQGAYMPLTSPYMENSSLTGNSTAAWYVLADPNDLSVIETVFVGGRDTPTVEQANADFNMLGIAMRGYIDFGVALQEYRGGVRAAGS